jgi:hypothetical protein
MTDPFVCKRAGSLELNRECLVRGPDAGGHRCTTEKLKTHKTESRGVLYPWHPFYGREVTIEGERNRRGGLMLICTSEGDGTGAFMEVPIWMFDTAVCCRFKSGTSASVNVLALRALRLLLNCTNRTTDGVIKAQHQSTPSGGSDAQTSKVSSDSDYAVSGSYANSASAAGGPSESGGSSCPAATPARSAKRKSNSSGGASR